MTQHRDTIAPTDEELLKLPTIHSTILWAWNSTKMTYVDLANQLGLPLGTVKSRLNRARNALAKLREPKT